MLQTAQSTPRVYGYYQPDGLFIPDGNIPKSQINRRAYIKFVDEETPREINKFSEKEIEERLAMVESLSGIIPPDVDLKQAREERLKRKGLL